MSEDKAKKPFIEITRMQLGEFEVPVPHGLSELLHEAGAWGPKRKTPKWLEEYDRTVEMRNGKLYTKLTKRKS